MKAKLLLLLFFFAAVTVSAQKVDYKDNIIKVNGVDVARVEKVKDKASLGMTSTFEIYSMANEKLVVAALATGFEANADDNTTFYYKINFVTVNQSGIFLVSKLGPEKSIVKLIGGAGIIVNGKLDESKVRDFIQKNGKNPKVTVDYTPVARNLMWPINFNEDKTIEQEKKTIGSFKYLGNDNGLDAYEFTLPTGVVVAKVKFSGGDNAKSCEMQTMKDNATRIAGISTTEKTTYSANTIDKNYYALQRIVKWLVSNRYF